MTPEQRKAYRTDMRGRFCDCDRPAVKYRSGDWICQRCLDIEDLQFKAGQASIRSEKESRVPEPEWADGAFA